MEGWMEKLSPPSGSSSASLERSQMEVGEPWALIMLAVMVVTGERQQSAG
jgi:hypothetical protein